DARLHAEFADGAHHVKHLLELRSVLDFAPGRPHAESRGAEFASLGRLLAYLLDAHERRRLDSGLEASTLRAIPTILRTAAGLDAEQDATLNIGRIVKLPMGLRCHKQQLRQWPMIRFAKLRQGFYHASPREQIGRA